jgi:UDP-glucose 4-epimerase
MFKNKNLLITGGTGSFGNAVLRRFLDSEIAEIRIFSRDEKKQDDMRKRYNHPKLKFYIGDVREERSLSGAMRGVDYVFHAAALKQVPSCEFFPLEAVNTNILGTSNVIDLGISAGVEKIVCLSTDKAVYPINSMGMSKALMEKLIISKVRSLGRKSKTKICITRYGNVVGSRGSVIPLFLNRVHTNQFLTITNLNMTRFMMSMSEAIDLVLFAFNKGKSGDIFVRKSPAATIANIVGAIKLIHRNKNIKTKIIGIRHGEKLHETLMSREERNKSVSYKNYFKIPFDDRDLNYDKYFTSGKEFTIKDDYTSQNTIALNLLDIKKIILDIDKN